VGTLAGKALGCNARKLSVNIPTARAQGKQRSNFLSLGGDERERREELRASACLDWIYPEEIDRAVLRDREVDELSRMPNSMTGVGIACGARMGGQDAIVTRAL